MFTPPRRVRKLFWTRPVRLGFVLFFLLATCLPSATPPIQAAPLPTPNQADLALTTQPNTPAQSTLFPGAPVTTAAANTTAAVSGPQPKTLPAHLQLDLDHAILQVGETANVTLGVISDGPLNDKGLQLLLDLPNGLATTSGGKGKLRWDVPALALGGTFRQVVPIIIDKPKQALKQGVLTLQATLSAPSADSLSTARLLGIAPTTPAPETQATIDGAVLQNPTGDVVLLVKPGAVKEGVTFRYTELRRVPRAKTNTKAQAPQVAPTTVLILTQPVTTAPTGMRNWLYLPLANASAANAPVQAAAPLTDTTPVTGTTPPPTATVQPVSDHNVEAYAIWQLDALQNSTRVPTFTQEVQLVVAVGDWVAQGVDPARLNLWTRESDPERWALVNSTYETTTQTFSAWLPHFSQFTLAQGLNNADVLPSVRAFSTDRTTGGATLQYPLETPKGLGGLSPQLSLRYSSIGVDDLYLDAGDSEAKAQASGVGIGWEIGGISRIVRSSGNLDNQTFYKDREYTLSLNGTFVRIRYNDGAWRTDPEIFAKIDRAVDPNTGGKDYAQWTITTADGLVYTFGDASVSEAQSPFNAASATGTFVVQQNGGAYERLAKEWYLVSVQDRLGNQIMYNYKAEQGTENGCVPSDTAHAYLRWYVRAIYPSEILWSGNSSQGVSPQMHVLFTYDPNIRSDWNITGSADNDCKLAKFAQTNRLLTMKVEVNAGGWQTLRSYQLSQAYNTTQANTARRLMLTGIDQKGKNGTVLNHYGFTYNCTPGACAALVNTIRLLAANNGWGGQINYTYTGYQPSASNSVCNNHCTRNAVTRTDIQDGLSHTNRIDYYYGPTVPAQSGDEWSAIDNTHEFLGFKRSQATYYAADLSTIVKWDQIDTWQGQRDDPDPRRGRIQHQEVRTGPGGTLLAVTDNTWNAYRRLTGDWDSSPTTHNSHLEGTNLIYDTLWVRLDATSEWTAGAGKFTQNFYERTRQNNLQFGNLTQVKEFSHAETSLDYNTWIQQRVAPYLDTNLNNDTTLNLLRTTVTEYFPNSAANIVNKPARMRVYNGSGACLAETRTIYDNLEGNYNSAPSNGLVSKTQQARNSCADTLAPVNDPYNASWAANWQETRLAYDAYGNQTVIHHVGTGSADNDQTITTYDSVYHLFPVTQYSNQNSTFQETATYYGVNRLGLGDAKAFWGALQEYCAVNEVCTRQSYDEFGRRVYRWDYTPKGSAWATNANASVNYSYIPYGGAQTTTTIAECHNPRSEGNFTRRLYNGLGQLVQEQTPYQGWTTTSGQEILVDHAYDPFGQQTQVSVPHLVATYSSGNIYRGASYAAGVTTTAYDALGRPTQTTAPNGEQTFYGYSGRSSSVYTQDRAKATSQADAYRINQWQELDGLGYVANSRTWTYNGNNSWTENARVTFTHDATGNLTSVTHPNSIGTTSMSYDLLGHKTSMTDVDLGSWSYAYDRQGKLTRQTDARNQTTCLYYENVLERVIGKYFTTGTSCPASVTSYNVSYGYDANHNSVVSGEPVHSRGQLTSVGKSGLNKTLLYERHGLLWNETTDIAEAPAIYTTWHGYDAYQRPNVLIYPDGEQVVTTYNGMGLPNLLGSTPGYGTIVDNVSYDEAGRLTARHFPLGGNLWETRGYHPWMGTSPSYPGDGNGRFYYAHLGTSYDAHDRLTLGEHYDDFGNITAHYDNCLALYQGFTYDAQHRLTTGYGQSYGYDSAGRLTSYESNGAAYSTPTNARQPHGVKRVNLPASGGAAHTLTVRAVGTPAAGVWPQMELWVNGNKVTTWTVGGTWQNYPATATLTGRDQVDVVFTNDGNTSTEDRNLLVDWIQVDSQTPQTYSTAAYDRGVSAAAFDGDDVLPGEPGLWWSGAMRFVLGSGALALGYDANGNLSYKASATQTDVYTFDAENHLASVTRNGTVLESYLYDADGQRVRKEINATDIVYPNQYYEADSPSSATKYYYLNGQRVAMRKNGTLYYLHSDHLGSTVLMTKSDGTAYGNQGYYAYGKYRYGSWLPTDQLFTGQKQDGSGLIYMNARYYDPVLGQFISPDTLVPDATNVFDYNRYMYAHGNPMRYNDPTGHCALSAAMGPPGLAFDIPCWTSGAGEVAAVATAGAVAGAVAGQAVMNYVLNEPPLNYPPLYPDAGIGNGNISVTIPVPSSTTVTSGVPLTSDNQTTVAGVTPVNSPAQQLVEPLPSSNLQGNIVFAGQNVVGTAPPNLAPDGASRSGAFRQAKRDAGIPVSQQPDEVRLVVDRTNPGKMVREYDFGDITIQDHEWGHTYPDDPTQNRGSHFNLRPGGGHYDYQ